MWEVKAQKLEWRLISTLKMGAMEPPILGDLGLVLEQNILEYL